MGWEELTDFEREMYLAVVEQQSFAEVPRGSDERLIGGELLGPWDSEACWAHLLRWFDQGLIQLYEVGEDSDLMLSPSIARERLAAWDRWDDDDERWWKTCLVVTEQGEAALDEAAGFAS